MTGLDASDSEPANANGAAIAAPRSAPPLEGPSLDRPLHVFFVQHTGELSGSTISGQLVVRGFLRAGWHVNAAIGAPGGGLARYEELGCDVHLVPHKNWLRSGELLTSIRCIGAELAASREFMKLFRQHRPDLVYLNTIVSLSAAVAARRLGIPCVWHIRELFDDVGGEMRIPPLGGRRLVRRTIRACADHVVTISESVRENMLGADWSENVSVVSNAVDERFFDLTATSLECRHEFDLPADGIIIGVPGTLRPMKGQDFLLDAAALVVERGVSCLFVLTGDGQPDYVAHLRRKAEELRLTKHVRFLGSISRMPEFYRACDLVCIPSVAEPFGRTVIEAFACRVPVVATAVGGIRETVENGRTGLLVDHGDVPGLAEALIGLARDATARQRLSDAAHREACSRYSAEVYHERINRIAERTSSLRPVAVRRDAPGVTTP